MDYQLTDEQKQKITEVYNTNPDLIFVTKAVFGSEKIDGRSKEGRAVRDFLVEKGLKYRTSSTRDKVEDVELNEHKRNFILQNADKMTSYQMALTLFPEANIRSPLNKECQRIVQFLREHAPQNLNAKESAVGLNYSAPDSIAEAVAKINVATYQDIAYQKLSSLQRQCINAFLRFINSPRVIHLINSYEDISDRELFESEFIRFTWDKPDLTMDDIALYIGVCQDIVTNKRIQKHIEKLSKMFEETGTGEDQQELTIRLAENMKAKTDEYDKVQKRIESGIKKLNGDRAHKLEKQGEKTSNFLALVEAFQMEDERRRLLLIAKAAREKVKEEVDRLETLDEYTARILGVSKEEVL